MTRAAVSDRSSASPPGELCEIVAHALDVARVSLWRPGDDDGLWREHLYDARDGEHRTGGQLRPSDVPFGGEAELASFSFRAVDDVRSAGSHVEPTTAVYYQPVGVRSLLQVPVQLSEESRGVLWLEHTGEIRRWSQREQQVARSLVTWWERARMGAIAPDDDLPATLRAVIERASFGIFLCDGVEVTVGSRAFCELVGVEPQDLAGGYPLSAFLPDDLVNQLFDGLQDGEAAPRPVPIRHPDGEMRWGLIELTAVGDAQGLQPEDAVAGWLADITALKSRERELAELAYSDPLTGLANRRLLHAQGERSVALADRHDRALALLYVDLNDFKRVNDALGHAAGDEVLVEVAERLREQFRASDIVARIGGDEFAVLLTEVDDREGVSEAAERLVDRLQRPVPLGDEQEAVELSGAVGIALFPPHAGTFAELLRVADEAMYRAKQAGETQVHVALGAEGGRVRESPAVTARDLRSALTGNRLALEYQPVFSSKTDPAVGAEALVRLRRPDGRLLAASEILPVAEESGEVGRLDLWVVEHAPGGTGPKSDEKSLWLSTNLSARTIQEQRWVRRLIEHGPTDDGEGLSPALEIPWPTGNAPYDSLTEETGDALRTLQEAEYEVWLELTSAEPSALAVIDVLSPDGVKVPQDLLQEIITRSDESLADVIAWMWTGWNCPITVSRLDDPMLRERLEALEVDVLLQGRELCPPVPGDRLWDAVHG